MFESDRVTLTALSSDLADNQVANALLAPETSLGCILDTEASHAAVRAAGDANNGSRRMQGQVVTDTAVLWRAACIAGQLPLHRARATAACITCLHILFNGQFEC